MASSSIKVSVLGAAPTRLRQIALVARDIDQARQLLVRGADLKAFHYN